MRAIEYILEYNKYDRIIKSRLELIEYLKSVAEGCTAPVDGNRVQSSGVSNKIANTVTKYSDLEKELEEEIRKAQKKKLEILHTVEQLPSEQYEILYLLYIRKESIKAVEIDLNRSRSWIKDRQKKGLINLQAILDRRIPDDLQVKA